MTTPIAVLGQSAAHFPGEVGLRKVPATRWSALPHRLGEFFVLVAGDQVDSGGDLGFPADLGGLVRAEIVGFAPTFILARKKAIHCVEPNPVAEFVSVID